MLLFVWAATVSRKRRTLPERSLNQKVSSASLKMNTLLEQIGCGRMQLAGYAFWLRSRTLKRREPFLLKECLQNRLSFKQNKVMKKKIELVAPNAGPGISIISASTRGP